jgi:hypothetical protein
MSDITYNSDIEQILKSNGEECESFAILHRMAYERFNIRSNIINIPVIVLSSAIGFITGVDLQVSNMNIILGLSSVFVGIIKSIDSYFGLGKRAESHRMCSLQFSQINKRIAVELSLPRHQRINAKDMLQIVKLDIKNLHDIAPLIDEEDVEKYKSKYGHPDGIKQPSICNGLSQIAIRIEEGTTPKPPSFPAGDGELM